STCTKLVLFLGAKRNKRTWNGSLWQAAVSKIGAKGFASRRSRASATHSYTNPQGRTPAGKRIWEKLVRKHPGVFMVLSGHIGAVSLQMARNDAGAIVYEMLTDYQSLPNGGDGLLGTLRFVPGENRIHVEAFSPTLKEEKKYLKATYSLDYDMGAAPLKKAG
ncbi:MAG: hypothetical protein NTW96_14350, partial [Planctomycetia bacterium]|nr:hypothetical protein [Planctomycetia bacterium]